MGRFLDPYQPPPEEYKPLSSFDVTTGQRIAGGLLLVNAVIVLASAGLDPESLKIGGFSRGPLSIVLDLVVGFTLLNRSRSLLWLALVRVVLGLLIFVGIMVMKGEYLAAVVQSALSCSLLLLLIGQAGRARIITASILFASYALVAALGLYGMVTGHDVITQAKYELGGDTEPAPTEIVGVGSDYHLRIPSDRWSLRTAAAAHKDNPLADRWLVRPDLDAHVLIVAETEAGALVLPEPYADNIVNNLRSASSKFTLKDRTPLRQYPAEGRLLSAEARVDNLDIDYLVGTVAVYGRAYQIMGFTSHTNMPAARADILAIIESFTLPTTAAPPPADVEPGPAKQVTGVTSNYTLTAANDRWYTRTPEATRASNPAADRWLIRPDLDAHILVIPEQPDEHGYEIDSYLASVRATASEANPTATLGEATPLTPGATDSRTFQMRGITEGNDMVFDYAVFVAGNRAYQVIGFTRADLYPKLEAEVKATLASFKPPR